MGMEFSTLALTCFHVFPSIMTVDMDFLLDRAINQLIEDLPPPKSKNREKYELFA